MKTYTFQVFDSRNTCQEVDVECSRETLASERARLLSLKGFGKVIVNNVSGFEEYEQGKLTSWSYPNGLGQIKLNS
jgi:hypothetical protein